MSKCAVESRKAEPPSSKLASKHWSLVLQVHNGPHGPSVEALGGVPGAVDCRDKAASEDPQGEGPTAVIDDLERAGLVHTD